MAESSSSEVTLALLRSDILKLQDDVSRRFDDVERKLDRVNGSVRQHETRIALLENFCKEQVKPALAQVVENRVQIAEDWKKKGHSRNQRQVFLSVCPRILVYQ